MQLRTLHGCRIPLRFPREHLATRVLTRRDDRLCTGGPELHQRLLVLAPRILELHCSGRGLVGDSVEVVGPWVAGSTMSTVGSGQEKFCRPYCLGYIEVDVGEAARGLAEQDTDIRLGAVEVCERRFASEI